MRAALHIFLLVFFAVAVNGDALSQKKSKKNEVSYKERLKFERLFIDASKAKILADYEQALKLYESCKNIDPSAPAVYYELASLYLHFGRLQEARENAEFAAKNDKENIYFRLMYAETMKASKELKAASQEYEGIIKDFPTQYSAFIDLAMIKILLNDIEGAIKVYDRLEDSFGPLEEVKLKKQFLYLQLGKVEDAAEEIKDLIEIQPENVKYYVLLAELYNANDMEDKAIKAYRNASEKFPENAEIHLSLANYYNNKKQYKKGLEHIEAAFRSPDLDIDSKVKTLLNLFDIANDDGGYKDDLINLGAILLEAHPKNAKILTINGDISLNLGHKEEARSFFSQAVSIDGSRYPIWSQLLIIEAELDEFDSLVYHGNMAQERFPNQPLCYYFTAYGHSRLEEHREAAEKYEMGLKMIVDNDLLEVQFLLGMADAYHQTGEHDKSDKAFDKVLELEPNNAIALNNYSYYLSERNEDLEKALKMSGKSNDLEKNSSTYLDTYAWILYKMQRYEDAKTYMEKALSSGGDLSGVILEHMGDVLFRLGKENEAYDYWMKAKLTGEHSDFIDQKLKERKLYE